MNRREFLSLPLTAIMGGEDKDTQQDERLAALEYIAASQGVTVTVLIQKFNHNAELLQEVIDHIGLGKGSYYYEEPDGGTA